MGIAPARCTRNDMPSRVMSDPVDVVPDPAAPVAGERRIASCLDGRLVLTDRRVVHRFGTPRREAAHMLLLDKVTSVSLDWRLVFRPWLTIAPLGLFLATMGTLILIGDLWAYNDLFATVGLSLSAVSLVLVVSLGRVLRVGSPGDILRVRIPHRHLAQTRRFVAHVRTIKWSETQPLSGPLEGAVDAPR